MLRSAQPVYRQDAPEAVDLKILAAARELFGESGARVTIAEIADRARVARATVFRRFGGKGAVITAMFEHETETVFAELDAIVAGAQTAREGLIAVFDRSLDHAQSHPLVRRFTRTEPRVLLSAIVDGYPAPIQRWRVIVIEAASAALPSDGRRRQRATAVADTLAHLVVGFGFVPQADDTLQNGRSRGAYATFVVDGLLTAP
jgi:AcrR family transcriptional regulator